MLLHDFLWCAGCLFYFVLVRGGLRCCDFGIVCCILVFLVCFVLREIGFYVVFNLIVLGTSWAIDVVDFWFGHATSVVFYCLLVFAVPV